MSNPEVLPDSQVAVEAELSIPGLTVRVASWSWTRLLEHDWYPPFYHLALLLAKAPPLQAGPLIPPGSLIFAPADTCLRVRSPPGTIRCVTVEFDRAWFEEITGFDRPRGTDLLYPCRDVKHPQLAQSLLSLAREAQAPGRASRKFAEGVGIQTAIYATRYLERARAGAKSAGQGLLPWQLRRITDHIERMPGYMPETLELARLCGVGGRHLRRLFKQTTGQTISQYARDAWVTKVKWLLTNTSLALKEIAARMGFADPTSFAAAFRSAVGVTPKVFRQQAHWKMTH